MRSENRNLSRRRDSVEGTLPTIDFANKENAHRILLSCKRDENFFESPAAASWLHFNIAEYYYFHCSDRLESMET